ncbi:DUF1801 domain-containing protein [Gaetbulibacter sp. M235]|uniref:DUF1801 domain-containing protein n=1 Tax=Gaetbulibacter sp. M235 TaxID=3126510 RepID=UPI00374E7644
MTYSANTPEEYILQLPEDRQAVISKLRNTIKENLPKGFEEAISYGMIGFVVPHTKYPAGYHCSPELPLPFLNIASQKNFVAVYHMGIYIKKELFDWFINEFPKYSKTKLDMGKSCIRFKKMDDIPYELLGELATKMTVDEWIQSYESVLKKN